MDSVNHPPHYTKGKVEVIDSIESALGTAFTDYCIGNVIKYVSRWRDKNGIEDLKKAQWYLNRTITSYEATTEKLNV